VKGFLGADIFEPKEKGLIHVPDGRCQTDRNLVHSEFNGVEQRIYFGWK